jgi:outer membrane receptor protein involved in Fe transport
MLSGQAVAARLLAGVMLAMLPGFVDAEPAEQITVTAPSQVTAPESTTVLNAADIARSGTGSIAALLDQVPAFGAQGVNAADTDGGFGATFIDLRNLNFDRTLVLVDGHRFVLSGIQTDEAVDLNDIPAAFIDHIEVLKDGTQPKYAADAVAGAVNLVLKDHVEGLHLEAYGAATGRPDGGTADLSLVGGHGFSGGHVVFGLDVTQRDAVRQSSRGWSSLPIASATATPTGDQLLYGSPATPGGHAVGPGIDARALGNGGSAPYDAATDFYNPAGSRDLQGGLQRETFYVDGDALVTDAISANVELLYTQRRATTLQPPQTLGLNGTLKNPDGFTIPASDPSNPFGAPVTLERIVSEAGAQSTTTSGPVWRALGGLDGQLGSWAWSVSFDHGQSLSRYMTDNEINLTRALQTAGNGACLAAAGCVLADWFGPGSLSARALDYIAYTGRSQSSYAETIGQALLTGPVFALPGGPARLELGVEARAESGSTTVDPVTARGDQAGNDAAATQGSYQTAESYAMLTLPLLKDAFLAKRLALSGAVRGTTTSRYGAFATFRGMLDYEPVPGLRLRAISGVARRPPAISEAFGGITGQQQPVTDPCDKTAGLRANPVVDANCRRQGLGPGFTQAAALVDVESGGNPQLRPESSENEMLGLTLQPPGASWLTASVDYYHYRITDAIDSLADTDPDLIPTLCYTSVALSSPLCSLITRIAGGGNAGQISAILARDENVGTIKEDGLEFEVKSVASPVQGTELRLDWQTNWLLDDRLHTLGQPGFIQYAGTFPGLSQVGSYARVRARASAELVRGAFSFGWTGRYLSGARVLGADAGDLFGKAPGIFYQDVDVSRRFGGLTVMAGIDNLTDARPPTLIDGETNTNTSSYDVLGRLFWMRLSYDF